MVALPTLTPSLESTSGEAALTASTGKDSSEDHTAKGGFAAPSTDPSASFPIMKTFSTQIRPEVMRGIRMSRVLQRWGTLLRTSPVDLELQARGKLWKYSEECLVIESFLSQSWSSPGWQKYLALLLSSYWRPACVAGFVTGFFCMSLDGLDCLPTVEAGQMERIGWDGSYGRAHLCPWCVVPPLAALITLFCGPKIPFLPDRLVFFDATCINQVDQQLKTEGIYSLAGFLANSKELTMLWAQDYFRRAWCVFEVAVFVAVHGSEAVRFSPLFTSTALFIGYVMFTVCSAVLAAADCANTGFDLGIVVWLVRLITFALVPYLIHRLRMEMAAAKALVQELEHFNIEHAQCRLPEDFEFIREFVEQLWGSTDRFNSFVRGNLRVTTGDLSKNFGYRRCLMIVLPMAGYSLQSLMSYVRAGINPSDLLVAILGHANVVLFLMPLSIKLVLELCFILAKPYARFLTNVACTGGITLVSGVLAWGCWIACLVTTNRLRFGSTFMFSIGALASIIIFHPKWCHRLNALLQQCRTPRAHQPTTPEVASSDNP